MAKKIGAIVSLTIIGILIVLTIVMASIKVNHNIVCETPQAIWVYSGGLEQGAKEDETKKIVELVNEASKENCLSAMFGGNLDATAKVVSESGVVSISADKYYVRYHYTEKQNLTEGKSIYKDGDGNSYKYEDLLFELTDTDGAEIVKVYVIEDSVEASGLKYTHYYNLWADFSDLYEYVNSRF